MKFRIASITLLGVIALLAQTTKSVWDGVYTDAQAKRGQALYQKECASCHGPTLEGGESAPPLTGDSFLANWNGLSVGELFDRIRVSMPQDNPGRLSRQQDSDILAFMFSGNKFPAGKAEMPTQSEVLKQIKIEPAK